MDVITRDSVTPSVKRETRRIQVKELPSKFKPYPQGTEIYFYTYSIGELEECTEIFESEDIDKLRSAYKGIECVGIKPEQLDYQDLIYIMILRKLTTFHNTLFTFEYDCPKSDCGKHVKQDLKLDSLEFNDLPEELVSLPIKYTLKEGVNAGKQLILNTVTAEKFIEFAKLDLPQTDSSYLAMTVQDMSIPEALELIKTVSGDDLEVLFTVRELLDFGEQKVAIKCPHCERESSSNVEVLSQLAIPFRRDRKSILSEIYASS